ncbi:MAG TPA: alpha/beta fold hydrolase [Pseudomonas sp.]|nr:alpha/beta fold hydrolase [Pseudomonas sp.]
MRLVLLPGLNGSSRLFAPLLAHLQDLHCEIIELPQRGAQDYPSLAGRLIGQLSDTPFVLLGESFSGPLAHHLALQNPSGLRGLVFAASFLQPPHPLTALASRLPIPKRLLNHHRLLRLFCVGDAPDDILRLLQAEVRDLPDELVRARLKALAQLRAPQQRVSTPALHLWPTRDRLVTNASAASIANGCGRLIQERIEGPHFLLQSRPQACAAAIGRFMEKLSA